jgi:hypothetical protein
MTTVWPFIRRLINIVFGYMLAATSSGLVVASLLQVFPKNPMTDTGGTDFFGMISLATAMITIMAAPPAIITIMIGEWWHIRRKRYYAIAGTLIGLALGSLFYMVGWFPFVGFGYGSVAGLIYWFTAGQRAGVLEAGRASIALQIVLAILFVAIMIAGFGTTAGLPLS